jgi:hypothetical protein
MKLLIFSSPLHYMVALLVKKHSGEPCLGLYLQHNKNCADVFKEISNRLGIDLDFVVDVDLVKNRGDISELVVSNRFDHIQMDLVLAYKGRVLLSFMEEGASIYLKESHLGKGLRDDNYWLRFKQLVKVALGRRRYFIPMNMFSRGYSFCAAEIPFLNKSCQLINITETFLTSARQSGFRAPDAERHEKRALVLSQWFVAKNILTESEMVDFYTWMHNEELCQYDKVYYKPHPWDSPEFTARIKAQFGFLSLDNEHIPVELWLATHPDVDLYGFWTSTMVYCNGVLENKAISVLATLAKRTKNSNIEHQYHVAKELLDKAGVKEI